MVAGSLASSNDVNTNFETLRLALNDSIAELAKLANHFLRQPVTQYYVNDVVYVPNSKFCLVCISEGTTSDTDLDFSNISDNINIVDGSVTWRVGYKNKLVGCALTLGSALPIGTIFSSCILIDDDNTCYAPLNGKVIAYTEYPDFFDYIISCADNNKICVCTIETYNQDIDKYGQCGYFVVDRVNKTVKLPTITRFISGLTSVSELGKTFQDQIRNITAYFWSGVTDNCSGAASQATSGERGGGNPDALSGGYILFDASKQVPTGSENQPKHTRYPYYVVISQSNRKGLDGVDGKDGVSPIIEVVNENNACYLKITDSVGTVTTPNLKADTPIKGVDYFTDSDILEVAGKINSEKILLTNIDVEPLENTSIKVSLNTSIYKISPVGGMNISFDVSELEIGDDNVITFEVLISMPDVVYSINFQNVTWIEENMDISSTGSYLFVFRSFDKGASWIGNLQGNW